MDYFKFFAEIVNQISDQEDSGLAGEEKQKIVIDNTINILDKMTEDGIIIPSWLDRDTLIILIKIVVSIINFIKTKYTKYLYDIVKYLSELLRKN